MAEITIRPARFSDAEELSQLIFENSAALLKKHYSPAQWNAFISYYSVEALRQKIETQQVFCALQANQIVGTIALNQDFVVGFYTRIQNQRQGIGQQLMNFIVQVAKQKGLTQIQLAASPVALNFYVKNGWQSLGNTYPIYADVQFEETLMHKIID